MVDRRRAALITGGTRGIGLGIAHALAKEGFDLILCGRRPAHDIAPVVDSFSDSGVNVVYVQADMGEEPARRKLIEVAKDQLGALHVLVNNAGMAPRERRHVLEASEESYEELMRVNLQGPHFLTQAAARWMIEQRASDAAYAGCIINVNSISSTLASIHRGEYCISKAGLSMSTKLWAVALAPFDIPVFEVRPGIIATDMTAAVKTKYDQLIEEGLTLQPRWGQPADVGKAVAMLARGDLPYATGQVIMIDGGLTVERL